MERIQSILVSVGREGPQPAVVKGLALAQVFGAGIELFLCDAERAYVQRHQYDAYGVALARESCLAESRRYLDELRNSLLARGVTVAPVSVEAACESPLYEAIVREVRRSGADLVVRYAGAGEPGASSALRPSEWELARTCPVPLLLTRGQAWKRQPVIAAAIDLSGEESPDLTRAILRAAALFAAGCSGSLEVVHAAVLDGSRPEALEAKRNTLMQRAAAADARAGALHVLAGEPAVVLPELAAARDYDVLVLGARTHRKALTALVGTLTGRLIETLHNDFLLVPPPTKS